MMHIPLFTVHSIHCITAWVLELLDVIHVFTGIHMAVTILLTKFVNES